MLELYLFLNNVNNIFVVLIIAFKYWKNISTIFWLVTIICISNIFPIIFLNLNNQQNNLSSIDLQHFSVSTV